MGRRGDHHGLDPVPAAHGAGHRAPSVGGTADLPLASVVGALLGSLRPHKICHDFLKDTKA